MHLWGFFSSEEFVIEQTVRAVTLCCELGLFTKPVQCTLTPSLVRLLAHPSLRVRFAAAAYVGVLARRLGMTDLHASLRPLLAPHLKQPMAVMSAVTDMDVLLDALNPPVSREAYDYVVNSPAHEACVIGFHCCCLQFSTGLAKQGFGYAIANSKARWPALDPILKRSFSCNLGYPGSHCRRSGQG
jgi:hypothetical protein